jgi:2-polyprenyl-3-methyl-5-hydroxy-6-metoxy-1,4-benzoquinol methylase
VDLEEAYRKIWDSKMVGIQPPEKQSIDRVTWTASLFRPEMKGESLLDLGTGSGAMLYAARAAGMSPVGLDFDKGIVKWLVSQGYNVEQVDLNKDPICYETNRFGVVTSCDVIEHLSDPGRMLAEAFRLLKPGGRAFIATPNCSFWRRVKSLSAGIMFRTSGDNYLKDGGHLAYYAPADFVDAIRAAGFKSVNLHFFKHDPVPGKEWSALAALGANKKWAEHTYMIAEAIK